MKASDLSFKLKRGSVRLSFYSHFYSASALLAMQTAVQATGTFKDLFSREMS